MASRWEGPWHLRCELEVVRPRIRCKKKRAARCNTDDIGTEEDHGKMPLVVEAYRTLTLQKLDSLLVF